MGSKSICPQSQWPFIFGWACGNHNIINVRVGGVSALEWPNLLICVVEQGFILKFFSQTFSLLETFHFEQIPNIFLKQFQFVHGFCWVHLKLGWDGRATDEQSCSAWNLNLSWRKSNKALVLNLHTCHKGICTPPQVCPPSRLSHLIPFLILFYGHLLLVMLHLQLI